MTLDLNLCISLLLINFLALKLVQNLVGASLIRSFSFILISENDVLAKLSKICYWQTEADFYYNDM